jgi:hypothetical protein
MAKKPKPEWGKSYPGLGGKELVSQEQALQVAKLANIPASQMNFFLEELFHIIHEFEIEDYLQRHETPIGSQRAALEELKKPSSQLQERMSQIDQTTRIRIAGHYEARTFSHELDAPPDLERRRKETRSELLQDRHLLLKRDAEHVRRFAGAVATALRFLGDEKRAKGGAPARFAPLRWAADRLAGLWEQYTGRRFTISRKRGKDEAATFVRKALKMLMPGATRANIATALRFAASRKAVEWRNKNPPKKREVSAPEIG